MLDDKDMPDYEAAVPFEEMLTYTESDTETTVYFERVAPRNEVAIIDDGIPEQEDFDGSRGDEMHLQMLKSVLQERKDINGDFAGWQNTLFNLRSILRDDPKLAGALAFNEMTHRPVFTKDVFLADDLDDIRLGGVSTLPLSDHHVEDIRSWLSGPEQLRGWGINAKVEDVRQSISTVSRKNRFNPVKDSYEAVEWDGVPRIDTIYTRYLGTTDDVYHRETSRLLQVAMCARAYEPGFPFDKMTIFQGLTGSRKSTVVKIFGGEHYNEIEASDMKTLEKKTEAMVGPHVIECPELTALDALPVNEAKQLISRGRMKVRLAWERETKERDLCCVIIGTTEKQAYLRVPLGNRRYLPIVLSKKLGERNPIDTVSLEAEMPQIRAEALVAFRQMKAEGKTHLELSEESMLIQQRLTARASVETEVDTLHGRIEEILMTPTQMDPNGLSAAQQEKFFAEVDGQVYRKIWCREVIVRMLEAEGFDAKAFRTTARNNDIATALEKITWITKDNSKAKIPGFAELGRQNTMAIDVEAFSLALEARRAEEAADAAPF